MAIHIVLTHEEREALKSVRACVGEVFNFGIFGAYVLSEWPHQQTVSVHSWGGE